MLIILRQLVPELERILGLADPQLASMVRDLAPDAPSAPHTIIGGAEGDFISLELGAYQDAVVEALKALGADHRLFVVVYGNNILITPPATYGQEPVIVDMSQLRGMAGLEAHDLREAERLIRDYGLLTLWPIVAFQPTSVLRIQTDCPHLLVEPYSTVLAALAKQMFLDGRYWAAFHAAMQTQLAAEMFAQFLEDTGEHDIAKLFLSCIPSWMVRESFGKFQSLPAKYRRQLQNISTNIKSAIRGIQLLNQLWGYHSAVVDMIVCQFFHDGNVVEDAYDSWKRNVGWKASNQSILSAINRSTRERSTDWMSGLSSSEVESLVSSCCFVIAANLVQSREGRYAPFPMRLIRYQLPTNPKVFQALVNRMSDSEHLSAMKIAERRGVHLSPPRASLSQIGMAAKSNDANVQSAALRSLLQGKQVTLVIAVDTSGSMEVANVLMSHLIELIESVAASTKLVAVSFGGMGVIVHSPNDRKIPKASGLTPGYPALMALAQTVCYLRQTETDRLILPVVVSDEEYNEGNARVSWANDLQEARKARAEGMEDLLVVSIRTSPPPRDAVSLYDLIARRVHRVAMPPHVGKEAGGILTRFLVDTLSKIGLVTLSFHFEGNLPPSPGQADLEFLKGVLAGKIEPPVCIITPWEG